MLTQGGVSFERAIAGLPECGAAYDRELTETGFDTGMSYDETQLRRLAAQRPHMVVVISQLTGTAYGCLLHPTQIAYGRARVLLVTIGGQQLGRQNYRMLTFVNKGGVLKVVPGWV